MLSGYLIVQTTFVRGMPRPYHAPAHGLRQTPQTAEGLTTAAAIARVVYHSLIGALGRAIRSLRAEEAVRRNGLP